MTPVFSDTSPETERVLFALLREMPPWRKLEMVAQLNQMVRELALSGLRERYPQADEAEVRRRLADLVLGPDLAKKAYGPLIIESTVQIDMNEIALRVEVDTTTHLLEETLNESGNSQIGREESYECH
jgi:hypothetical protein